MSSSADFANSKTPAPSPDAIAPSGQVFLNLFRRFIACNPLYLTSAGLLLYGVNKLSVAPGFVGAESEQITFNFTALFLYEVLLVVTAIVLARREIWYDALLLIALESLFVLVPFSLVSRAAQVNEPLSRNLCWAAVLLGVLKFWALKRYIPRLNLPLQTLLLGGAALGINVALSLALKHISEDKSALKFWLSFGWLFAMPALLALGHLVPKPKLPTTAPEQNAWLPFAALAIWIAATAGHLGGVGYIYSYDWGLAELAPTLWVLSWSLRGQLRFVRPTAGSRLLMLLPLLTTLLAIGDARIFFALNLLNTAAYLILWRNGIAGKMAAWLGFISFALTAAGLPAEWVAKFTPGFDRVEWVIACFAALSFIPIIRSRDPRWAIAGGVLCSTVGGALTHCLQISAGWAPQLALTFIILHSLRWIDDRTVYAQGTRVLVCAAWLAQSLLWLHFAGGEAVFSTQLFGVLVVGIYLCHWIWVKTCAPRVILLSGATVLLAAPGYRATVMASNIPTGYLAVAVSFILFGLGTVAALARRRTI